MKIGTWNMDFWKRTCNDKNSKKYYRTEEYIHSYKINAQKLINDNNFDFLLLQETNPFFYFDEIINKKSNSKWPYEFEHLDKKIYYQNFSRLNWGNTIVVNKKYIYLKYNISRCKNKYYSKYGQMFFDFNDEYGNIITIINIYNKCKDGNWGTYHETLENIIFEINDIVQSKNNLIILAGDFNCSEQSTNEFPNGDPKYIELFKKIKKIGFINCTENIGGTVSYNDYQDDYIFIKNYKSNIINKLTKHDEDSFNKFSDHYFIEINL